MSDLALFVAATIRDKVVLDLMEENKRLRKAIQHYNSVEITGPGGFPVYARAQADVDGKYDKGQDMWRISLLQNICCRLSDLADAEIRRGGSVKRLVTLALDESWGYVENNPNGTRCVVLAAGEGFSQIELSICIEGLPEERWHSLARADQRQFLDCLTGFNSHCITASFQHLMVEDGLES